MLSPLNFSREALLACVINSDNRRQSRDLNSGSLMHTSIYFTMLCSLPPTFVRMCVDILLVVVPKLTTKWLSQVSLVCPRCSASLVEREDGWRSVCWPSTAIYGGGEPQFTQNSSISSLFNFHLYVLLHFSMLE